MHVKASNEVLIKGSQSVWQQHVKEEDTPAPHITLSSNILIQMISCLATGKLAYISSLSRQDCSSPSSFLFLERAFEGEAAGLHCLPVGLAIKQVASGLIKGQGEDRQK